MKATVGKGCIKSCASNEMARASVVEFVWALAGSTLGKVTQCLAFDYLIVRIHVPLECPPLTPLPLQFPPLGSARRRLLIGREPSRDDKLFWLVVGIGVDSLKDSRIMRRSTSSFCSTRSKWVTWSFDDSSHTLIGCTKHKAWNDNQLFQMKDVISFSIWVRLAYL